MVGSLGFFSFFGFLIGSFIMNPLGDQWGRALTYRLSMILQIFANILLIISYTLTLHILSLFLFGFASAGRVGVGHIWMLEFIPFNKQSKYSTIIRVIDAATPILVSILFEYF
jgi:MFS family permease